MNFLKMLILHKKMGLYKKDINIDKDKCDIKPKNNKFQNDS